MFTLNAKEEADRKKWLAEHNKACTARDDSIGGRLTYSFSPTGIGSVFQVSCVCGAKEDLTDYDVW